VKSSRNGGLVVAPQDGAALALAISRLVDDTEMRLELGRRAREFAESNFERNAVLAPCLERSNKRFRGSQMT